MIRELEKDMVAVLHSKHNSLNKCPVCPQMRRWPLSAFLVTLMALTNQANAGEDLIQSQASIKETVETFITQGINKEYPHHQIKVSSLDPRLKLSACNVPLKGFLPAGGQLSGNTTIGIRCSGGKPWTIYVPAYIKALRNVVITARPLVRNATISKEDIRLEERNVMAGSDTYIFNPDHVLGMVTNRALASSTALTPGLLSAPILIRRGQQVIILADGAGIEVRMAGTALMDGAEGQIIQVKNMHSKRIVEGQVIQQGIIRVNM
jgi:flagella basal body P-ring formation protein FlgA